MLLRPAAGNRLHELLTLCTEVTGVSGALVGLLDAERAPPWTFIGTAPELGPRLGGLVRFVAAHDELVTIEDATEVPELASDPAVRAGLVRFIAGASLLGDAGAPLGVLVLYDPAPARMTDPALRFVQPFARQIEGLLAMEHRLLDQERTHAEQLVAGPMLRGVLDATTSVAIVGTTPEGRITFVNVGAERMLQITADCVIGKRSLVAYLEAEVGESLHPWRFRALLARSPDGAPFELEHPLRRTDGSTFPAALAVHPITSGQGAVIGHVIVARDLTDAHVTGRLKDDFVAAISHELRTPLTSILGSLGLLAAGLGGEMPPEGIELVQLARSNGLRLLRLVSDLLDFQKVATRSAAPLRKPHRTSEIVRRALELTSSTRTPPPSVPPGGADARVMVDLESMARALSNLIDNAQKFSPRGEAATITITEASGRARIVVTDRGSGVPESFRSQLFSSFAQADAGDTRRPGSTGLGLAVAKAIVNAHDGTIGYTPAPGGGSVFYIELATVPADVV